MSNRSMLEFNHDYHPNSFEESIKWADKLLAYLRSGDPNCLPQGVEYFGMRHHSEPAPMIKPDSYSVLANREALK